MTQEVERVCDKHEEREDCPDCLLEYSDRFREYGILLHDDEASYVHIRFCPFCGVRLPESLRDRWFDELKRLGVDPDSADVPEPYLSSKWWLSQAN
jgi:hypothetical protein